MNKKIETKKINKKTRYVSELFKVLRDMVKLKDNV